MRISLIVVYTGESTSRYLLQMPMIPMLTPNLTAIRFNMKNGFFRTPGLHDYFPRYTRTGPRFYARRKDSKPINSRLANESIAS